MRGKLFFNKSALTRLASHLDFPISSYLFLLFSLSFSTYFFSFYFLLVSSSFLVPPCLWLQKNNIILFCIPAKMLLAFPLPSRTNVPFFNTRFPHFPTFFFNYFLLVGRDGHREGSCFPGWQVVPRFSWSPRVPSFLFLSSSFALPLTDDVLWTCSRFFSFTFLPPSFLFFLLFVQCGFVKKQFRFCFISGILFSLSCTTSCLQLFIVFVPHARDSRDYDPNLEWKYGMLIYSLKNFVSSRWLFFYFIIVQYTNFLTCYIPKCYVLNL